LKTTTPIFHPKFAIQKQTCFVSEQNSLSNEKLCPSPKLLFLQLKVRTVEWLGWKITVFFVF